MKVYASLIDRLKTQHETVENILSAIDSSRIIARPQLNKWSIHDNIAHLVRYQPIFVDRINQILVKEAPSFGRYKAEEDPEFENWRALNIDTLIKQLCIDRRAIYDLITTLTEARLSRVGIHKKYGSLKIIQWTEFFLLHEAHHIFTIFQLAHDVEL